jgi:hypothetical protein
MARPTMLTTVRHARIVELLREGVPFTTACREVGVSASAGYEWLYRGWGTHPDRPPKLAYVAFARDVDAVFPGGFTERHQDEDEFAQLPEFPESVEGFADVQSSDGTESGRDRENGGETVGGPGTSRHVQAHEPFAEGFCEFRQSVTRASAESPQNRSETGEAPPAKASESQRNAEFAEVTEPGKSDTQRDRARAREKNGDTEPRHAPMPWLSQRSRSELSILDIEF